MTNKFSFLLSLSLFASSTALAVQCLNVHEFSKLKVAVVQYPIVENLTDAQFYRKVEKYVRDSKKAGHDLVVLPELISLDLIKNPSDLPYQVQLRRVAGEVTPELFRRAEVLAKELQISILMGSSPRFQGQDIVNTAMLVLPDGKKIMQDKVYLTPDEVEWGWKGGTQIKVFDVPWGRTAILICHDCEFPVLSMQMAKYKPEVILVPSMTGDRSGLHRVQWTAQARAIEHYAYVIHTGTTQGGREAYFGQASIITPQEPVFPTTVIRGNENQDQILSGVLDMHYYREKKARARIWPGRDQEMRVEGVSVVLEQPN